MSTAFDLRLVAYNALGARVGVLPDQGITITSTDTGPVLTATVSRKVLGQVSSLGTDIEVAVETWRAGSTWVEGRDSRFIVATQDYDDRDPSGTITLNGVGLAAWLMQAAILNGVAYYARTDAVTEAAHSGTISVSGTTFTWSGNPIGEGDRVQIVAAGSAKNISTGSIYYAHNLSGNNFNLTRNSSGTGAYINGGSASNVQVKRVVTRFVISSHQFTANQAVCTTAGSAMGLSDSTVYYVVNPTASTLQLATAPGGIPIDLQVASTALGTIYTNIDGQRVFNNATPGAVMSAGFLEARGRGWGVSPSDSSQLMLHSWTSSVDSTGAAWTTMASDPTTPAISCSFQPGTPLTQILSFMLTNQYAEWYATGRTIGLVNYGTGNDHSTDSPPIRIGRTATSVPITVDLTNERNSYTVRGYGAVYVQVTGTPGVWGVLEDYVTATGITSKTAATAQANVNIATNTGGQKGYVVTENAQEADYLPLIHYSRGDWVAAQVDSDAWQRLRVAQWTYTKTPDGAVTVSTTLQYVKRTAISKIAKGQVATSAGISDAGTSTSPALEDDTRKAASPTGITVTQVGTFAADDSATSVATVTWLPVNVDADGNPINVTQYEVWLRADGATAPYAVGATSALSMTLPALPSGHYYEVSVRAQSDTDQWGVLSAEVEFLTVTPTTVPNPPTAPTLSGKLGQVRVAWDGNLVDPTLGNVAPVAGFAYVQALYSTTSSGPWSPVGLNMGNAGFTSVSGLTVGSTYYFVLQAVNVVGVTSAVSGVGSFTVIGVTGPDMVANSVTTNTLAAGAVSADKLDLGTVPQGTPTDRVPMALPNSAYWSLVIPATTPDVTITSPLLGGNVKNSSSSATGIVLTPTAGGSGIAPVTGRLPRPAAGPIVLSGLSTGTNAQFQVRTYTSAADTVGTAANVALGQAAVTFATPAGTYAYQVSVLNSPGNAAETVVSAHVFEVIGAGGGGQAAQLSPQGLRLFDNNGNLAVDLTTSIQQYFTVVDNTGPDPVNVASVDLHGNAGFNYVSSATGYDIGGVLLTDPTDPEGLLNASPNGSTWDPGVPLMDRLGRGPVYDVTWASMDSVAQTTQYLRIAQDQFTLEDGRSYLFAVELGGLQTDLTSSDGGSVETSNVYVELQLNLSANTAVTSGTPASRAVVYSNNRAYFAFPSTVWAASDSQSTIDFANRTLPAGVPIFWQVNTNLSAVPSRTINFHEYGNTRGLTVIDLGTSNLTRPINGADTLADVTDRTTSGASSGTKSSGTTASSKTVTFTANSSRTWNSGGSNIVTGSGQYTNGASMYYGTGASDMGSWFGQFKNSSGTSMASVLSGKTVTSATLKVHCNYTYSSSGSSVNFGTASTNTAPSTIGTPANNTWTSSVKAGATLSKVLSSAIRSALASGGVQSFVIGVGSGGAGHYSIFNGASQSSPPQITVTYH